MAIEKLKIELMIFDLDGTLIDSSKVILNAVNHTLERLDSKNVSLDDFRDKFGLGVKGIFRYLLGTEEDEVINKAAAIFRDYWETNFVKESKLFPNVLQTLDYYKDRDMYILSNGLRSVIDKMISSFKIKKYFKEIITGDDEDCIKPSTCPIDKAISIYDLQDKKRSLIVGDMDMDIKSGKKAGINTCGVTYGIGLKDDIIKAGPDFIIDDIKELKNIVD